MHWYLVHTKPRQEGLALENLERQGYECYLPTLPSEKLRQGVVTVRLLGGDSRCPGRSG